MTGSELRDLLGVPADHPPGELLAAWNRRRSDIEAALAQDGQAKPVKLRLRSELRRLEEGSLFAEQWRIAAEVDRYLGEGEAEARKEVPVRSVARLCLEQAKAKLEALEEMDLKFERAKRLAAAEELVVRPPVVLAVSVSADPCNGAVLELVPFAMEGTLRRPIAAVRFVARQRFTIGRSGVADYTTRFVPDSEDNRQKTSTISRINTTLSWDGHQTFIQDGQYAHDGSPRPSTNGTVVDDARVGPQIALNFRKERRVRVGQFPFELSVLHFPATAKRAGLPLPPSGEGPLGCVRIQATGVPGQGIGVWMFSEASLGSGPQAAVPLGPSTPPIAGRIHWAGQRFWIEVPSEGKSVISLDGQRRTAGEVIDLQSVQELRVGDHRFRLQIA